MSDPDVNGSGLPASLTFEDTTLTIIDRDGRPWVTAADLASALHYADSRAVSKIYQRNTDEFTEDMSVVVNLTTTGPVPTEHRIFSPRGCHLIAMLARTERAKSFRRWTLDVLDHLGTGRLPPPPPQATALPPPEEQPPFCEGCAARVMWCEEGRSLLYGEPLTKAELSVVAAVRLLIADEVNRRIKEKAGAVMAALGLPDPAANLPGKRRGGPCA